MALKQQLFVTLLALTLVAPALADEVGPSGRLLTDRPPGSTSLEVPTFGISERGLALRNQALGALEDLVARYGLDQIRKGSPPYPSEFMSESQCASVRVASNRHKELMMAGYTPDPARELCIFTTLDAHPLVLRLAGRSVESYTVSTSSRAGAGTDLPLRLHVAEPALVVVEAFQHAGCGASGGFASFESQDCLRLEELRISLSTLIQTEAVR